MEKPRIVIFLYNVVAILIGIILVSVSVNIGDRWLSTLLEALGIGAIATGAVNFFDRFLKEKPTDASLTLIAHQRATIPQHIHDRKFHVQRVVDICAISLTGCLNDITRDRNNSLLHDILFKHEMRVRLMFVHPCSPYLQQRAIEEHSDYNLLQIRQRENVRKCIIFYKYLKEKYDEAVSNHRLVNPLGTLEIKLMNVCPYLTIERYDYDIYWGLYQIDKVGEKSPQFLVTIKSDYKLYEQIREHFNGLMLNHIPVPTMPANDTLVKVGLVEGVWLNEDLANALIGPNEVKLLLA